MGIMQAMDVGANGMTVHGKRIDIHAKNVANTDTPNYVRKIPVLHAVEDISFQGVMNSMKEDMFGCGVLPYKDGGVIFTGLVEDPTLGDRLYRPGHPDADEHGYVKMSNSNALVDIADASMAQRAYEASISVMTMAKSMALKALEIGQ